MIGTRYCSLLRSPLCLALLAGALLAGTRPALAHVEPPHPAVDPRHIDGAPIGGFIDISSAWLAHQGDDPHFSDPALDDSRWIVVTPRQPMSKYGLRDVDFIWYRTHVTVPPSARGLTLLLREFSGSEEVFVNGVQIGKSPQFPPNGTMTINSIDRLYPIPDAVVSSIQPGNEPVGQLTIAIRASIGRASAGGYRAAGLFDDSAVLLGNSTALADAASLHSFRQFTSNFINLALAAIVLLIALALVFTLPAEGEYIALSCYLLCVVGIQGGLLAMSLQDWDYNLGAVLAYTAMDIAKAVALLEFVRLTLGLQRTSLFVWYERALVLVGFPAQSWYLYLLYVSAGGVGKVPLASVAELVIVLISVPINLGLPALALWVWWKRRRPDALLLLVPLLFQCFYRYYTFAIAVLAHFHVVDSDTIGMPPIPWLEVGWVEVSVFVYNVTLLFFLIFRTVRIARARAEAAAEIAAAQTVQQVLLARASQPTPGFQVESVYLPAKEVGGDFFLVSPGEDGSVVAIVGDVSGKGLIAAMRVSMVLGVLSREESRDPDSILRGLNHALLSQGEMGFTTAACVHINRQGGYTLANAGHISPYIDGVEIVAPPALPLGLAPGQEYPEIAGTLPTGIRLVLMSDGVVEARAETGELYGFDRLPDLTRMHAHDIADIAQRFGQDDDITVLTIARKA